MLKASKKSIEQIAYKKGLCENCPYFNGFDDCCVSTKDCKKV